MTMSDPIADMLTRIRNANTAKHDTVDIPSSKMKIAIANILLDEGYIRKYEMVDNGNFQDIRITLKYGADKNDKIITGLKRIPPVSASMQRRMKFRRFSTDSALPFFHQPGVITDKKARELEVGGEILIHLVIDRAVRLYYSNNCRLQGGQACTAVILTNKRKNNRRYRHANR